MFVALTIVLMLRVNAQEWTLSVRGEVEHPLSITPEDFSKYPKTKVNVTNAKGETESYEGVLLFEILSRAGAPLGDSTEHRNQTWYLRVKARDGYKVIFALPEIDSSFGENAILLADRKNGAMLEKKFAPLQIVVPREHRHARWIRQVESLEILNAEDVRK